MLMESTMGRLLDLLYGKDRPPAATSADMDAKMRTLADEANRKVAEMEKARRARADRSK
jgi:hypothetical protein